MPFCNDLRRRPSSTVKGEPSGNGNEAIEARIEPWGLKQ